MKESNRDLRENTLVDYLGLTSSEMMGEPVTARRDAYYRYAEVEVMGGGHRLISGEIETKGCGHVTQVTTAREVHKSKVATWRSKYWIIGYFPGKGNRTNPKEVYILHPDDLEVFFSKCEASIDAKFNAFMRVWKCARDAGCDAGFLAKALQVGEAGSRLDNPKISWKLIRQNGTLLPVSDQAKARLLLRDFIANRPITTGPASI